MPYFQHSCRHQVGITKIVCLIIFCRMQAVTYVLFIPLLCSCACDLEPSLLSGGAKRQEKGRNSGSQTASSIDLEQTSFCVWSLPYISAFESYWFPPPFRGSVTKSCAFSPLPAACWLGVSLPLVLVSCNVFFCFPAIKIPLTPYLLPFLSNYLCLWGFIPFLPHYSHYSQFQEIYSITVLN